MIQTFLEKKIDHGVYAFFSNLTYVKLYYHLYFVVFTFTQMCIHCLGHLLPSAPHYHFVSFLSFKNVSLTSLDAEI
jgi:hypothetical protein